MSVDITNVAYTFGNELKLCLYSVNPEVYALNDASSHVMWYKWLLGQIKDVASILTKAVKGWHSVARLNL